MKKSAPLLAGLTVIATSLAFAIPPSIDNERVNVFLQQIQNQMQMQNQTAGAVPDPNKLKADIIIQLQTADLLKSEALKAGLDKRPETRAAWQNLEARFFATQYVDYLAVNTKVNENDVRRQYELYYQEFNLVPIVFTTKAAAEEGLNKLKKGMAYETLLKQNNPSAPSTNWIGARQLPAKFARLARKLVKGQITANVVEFEGRFYLLKLAEIRQDAKAPEFDQVKNELREIAKQDKVQQQIEELLKKNGVNRLD
ncbi:MAG: peptidyl-prolyl cis-trans isomerase [Snodgrassella sp.]|nr:peptidyl-prolyl cis-trans isomerase [Snodgrassella sp.]